MPLDSSLVINTGPLISLIAATGSLDPLRRVAPHVVVPFEVQREILAGGRNGFAVQQFLAEDWLDRRRDNTLVPSFLSNAIDPGEAAVISLALSESISAVCLDDLEARRVARLSGLHMTGSLGILIAASRLGEPISMPKAIDNMKRQGIWLSDRLIQQALRLANES